jgi:diguanylate cyclase (GGDEF)-like protein
MTSGAPSHTGQVGPSTTRDARPPRQVLSAALHERANDVSQTVLATWQQRAPDSAARADLRVRDDVIRTTTIATLAVAEFLMTGGNESEEQRRVTSATGKAPLRDTISLADLTKLFLYWRDATIAAVREECDRLGLAHDVAAEATAVVRAGSDGSIVRMNKQFDTERRRLQHELAEEQERLLHQAFHDALTGLPNRRLFFDRLTHALEIATRRPTATALLFLDVDRFKAVNDTFGHGTGDAVLVSVAERLSNAVRASDTVARLGGDEFVVLCEDLHDPPDEAVDLAQRITNDLVLPMPILGHVLTVSASVGIAVTATDADPDTFLMRADHAMYVAKRRGPGNHELWTDSKISE